MIDIYDAIKSPFLSDFILFIRGNARMRKEIPRPNPIDSIADIIMKKGNCSGVGEGISGAEGQMTCPNINVGTANNIVIMRTKSQRFIFLFIGFD